MSHAEYLNDYEAKHQILEVGRRMYEKGFVASNDGNISCRVSETELKLDGGCTKRALSLPMTATSAAA